MGETKQEISYLMGVRQLLGNIHKCHYCWQVSSGNLMRWQLCTWLAALTLIMIHIQPRHSVKSMPPDITLYVTLLIISYFHNAVLKFWNTILKYWFVSHILKLKCGCCFFFRQDSVEIVIWNSQQEQRPDSFCLILQQRFQNTVYRRV